MPKTIYCIVNEQREEIYNDLKGIDSVRTMLAREGFAYEQYAAELKGYTDRIVRLLNGRPRDPRCEQPVLH
jgi:hypothetical protein